MTAIGWILPFSFGSITEGKSVNTGIYYAKVATLLIPLLIFVPSSSARVLESMMTGVVKVSATTFEGKHKVGTGFIVRLESDAVYIVTAFHVVEGDDSPRVEFFTRKNRPVSGKVVGSDYDDPKGLAVLLVERGIPTGLSALKLASDVSVHGGDPVTTIGFPRISGVPWAVIKGHIVGQRGRTITFDGAVDDGNSGGPLIKEGRVIGVITEVGHKFTCATPAAIAQYSLRGWGIEPAGAPQPAIPDEVFTNSIDMKFALIPSGTFMMGSPLNEPERDGDERQHRVTISKPFYMQTTEVTQGQWRKVMGNNPSNFKNCGDDCPVETVSWNDAQEFIRMLNQRERTDQYRLPTEAEWEYACRAETETAFSFGKCLSTGQANYNGNYPMPECEKGEYRDTTVRVGSFLPNAWGLYDMHGNVWEWCQDLYSKEYPSGHVTDPKGPSSGSNRVIRGGSWSGDARLCRSAYRKRDTPGYRYRYLGFRLARIR